MKLTLPWELGKYFSAVTLKPAISGPSEGPHVAAATQKHIRYGTLSKLYYTNVSSKPLLTMTPYQILHRCTTCSESWRPKESLEKSEDEQTSEMVYKSSRNTKNDEESECNNVRNISSYDGDLTQWRENQRSRTI